VVSLDGGSSKAEDEAQLTPQARSAVQSAAACVLAASTVKVPFEE
jgi:hypothetical protein